MGKGLLCLLGIGMFAISFELSGQDQCKDSRIVDRSFRLKTDAISRELTMTSNSRDGSILLPG